MEETGRDKNFLFKGLGGLLSSTFLLDFGFSMAGIFIPLYIFKSAGLNWLLLFYFVYHGGAMVSALPAAKLIARFGSDRLAMVGTSLRTAFFIVLVFANNQPLFFPLAGILWGLAIPLYWLPFHLSVTGVNHDHFNQAAAKITLVSRLGSIAGPVVGGLVVQTLGFTPLYLISAFFLLISGLPLLFDRYEFKFPEISFREIKKNLPLRRMFRLYLAYAGSGFTNRLYDIAWPLYVFLMVSSYEFLGTITSAGLFLSFVLLLAVGRLSENLSFKSFRASLPLGIMSWLARAFVSGKACLFLVDLFYQLVLIFAWVPLDGLAYRSSVKTKRLEFFLGREMAAHTGGLLTTLILFLVFRFQPGNWFLVFSLGSLGMLMAGQLGLKPRTYAES